MQYNNLEQEFVSWDALCWLDDLRLERQLYSGIALALLKTNNVSSTSCYSKAIMGPHRRVLLPAESLCRSAGCPGISQHVS